MKNKPTIKSIRQGQTIYLVSLNPWENFTPRVSKIFISGVDVPEYCIMDHASPARIRDGISRFGSKDLYYSRRKADSAMKALSRK